MQDKRWKVILMLVAPIVAIAVQLLPVIPTWEEFKFNRPSEIEININNGEVVSVSKF